MHRHILKIGPVHFEARVVERLDEITITLTGSHPYSAYGPEASNLALQWLLGANGVITAEAELAHAAGKCLHVLDHQHIMTT